MADESMQSPPGVQDQEFQADTEIPVRLDSLEADGTRPAVGDEVTVKIVGTVKSIENEYAYINADQINDTDIDQILADTSSVDEDAMMEKMTKQADMGQMPPSGGGYG